MKKIIASVAFLVLIAATVTKVSGSTNNQPKESYGNDGVHMFPETGIFIEE